MTADMLQNSGIREFILAFADDEHLMGQQHTEWIGVAPFLEEDLALASIGQDELGHAAMLYELLAGDDDQAIDDLAFGRGAADYRSCHLVEFATTNWADVLVRHYLYDSAEQLRWELLERSSIPELGEIANHVRDEESFHRRHADGLLDVLLQSATPRRELHAALKWQLPLALAMFDGVAGEAEAVEGGVASAPFVSQLPTWSERLARRFSGFRSSDDSTPAEHGARTVRSADWDPLMARMREVFELDPAAIW